MRRAGAILLAACLGVAGAAAAQDDPVGRLAGQTVVTVRLVSEAREVVEPSVVTLVESRQGEPLRLAQVRETILHLFSLGRFQDVQASALAVAGGVALTYDLVPLHVVDSVEFRGTPGVPDRQQRQALRDRFGRTPPAGQASAAASYLQSLLRDRGFVSAAVTPRIEIDHERERSTLVFEVEAGIQALIGAITVTGSSVLSTAQAVDRMRLAIGDSYDRTAIDAGVTRFLQELRKLGYYEAQVSARTEPLSERTVSLIVNVRPGPKLSIVFQGDPLSKRELEEFTTIEREGTIDEDLLEDTRRQILERLRAGGYRNAQVEPPRREPVGANAERIVFTVKRGRQTRVAAIEAVGVSAIPAAELTPLIALDEGDLFIQSRLNATRAAIRQRLRQDGFTGADVKEQIVDVSPPAGSPADTDYVAITLAVQEGIKTIVGRVTFEGHERVPEERLQSIVTIKPGQPFYEPRLVEARDSVHFHYLDVGYPNASITTPTVFSDDRSSVDVTFQIREGPLVQVDHVIIVGNTRTRTSTIERELMVKTGEPLSQSKIMESQRRLSSLGLFRRVRITELTHAEPNRRDVLVSVEEAPATSIGYGAGVEASTRLRQIENEPARERLEFAPRGFFEVGRRNLWGKNRSIDLFTRLSARPRNTADGGYGLNEYRGLASYREPRTFGWNADAFVSGVLERAIRSSFSYDRRAIQAQLVRRIRPQLSVSGHYSFERTKLFDAQIDPEDELIVDRLYPRVRLSSFSSAILRDTRNDPLDPEKGLLLGLDTELAARAIGSQVGFAKVFGQAFWFRRLPGARRVIFATGARIGLGRGFPQDVQRLGPVVGPTGVTIDTIEEIPASKRFFAGGDNTVRGFALDRLGDTATLDINGVPTGGNAVLVFNGELRMHVWRDLGAVVFLDGGNVFARVGDVDLGALRGGAGFGIRYQSPFGPIRLDIGFKLDRQTFANGSRERLTGFHISIGQAF